MTAAALPQPGAEAARRERRARARRLRVVLLIVWTLAALYAGFYLKRGWVPHDEGMLAQSATRFLHGELPHRDFDEPYTGGLTMLNAAAMRIFGVTLAALRWMLFLAFLAWVPAFYFLAVDVCTAPWAAGGLTLLAVAWSVPNYSAAMPSWYNLFFATWGLAGMLRFQRSGQRRWLFFAGGCVGLSVLAKIVGLYFLAALLLFLLYEEQDRDQRREATGDSRPYRVFLLAGLALFVGALAGLLHGHRDLVAAMHFLFPGVGLAAVLVRRELRRTYAASAVRFGVLAGLLAPLLLGTALPLLALAFLYLRVHALSALLEGVFVLPFRRLQFAAFPLPPLKTWPAALPILGVLGLTLRTPQAVTRRAVGLCAGGFLALLLLAQRSGTAYRLAWYPLTLLVPVTAAMGVWVLWREAPPQAARQRRLFLFLATAALCSLVEYPFSVPVYFCFVFPLSFLALAALIELRSEPRGRPSTLVPLALLVFYLLFAVWRFTPGWLVDYGYAALSDQPSALLRVPRAGGLRISPVDADVYQQLVGVVEAHAHGRFIYAAPDCPEVYFLSGRRNPTRTMFEFFDDPNRRTARILNTLQADDVRLVVINTHPLFSGALDATLGAELARRFPASQQIGPFTVRWRS